MSFMFATYCAGCEDDCGQFRGMQIRWSICSLFGVVLCFALSVSVTPRLAQNYPSRQRAELLRHPQPSALGPLSQRHSASEPCSNLNLPMPPSTPSPRVDHNCPPKHVFGSKRACIPLPTRVVCLSLNHATGSSASWLNSYRTHARRRG